jgi:hypothetical protein
VLEEDEGFVDNGDEADDAPDSGPVGHAEPAPIQKFRTTAVGSVLAAGLLGLRDVIEPPKDEEPAIVESWAGDPFDDDMVLRLDPDNPADSIVMIRVRNRPGPGTTG